MNASATAFLTSLSPELKKKASFDFNDKHRTAWFFTPQQDKDKKFTRKGVRLEEMTAEQKKAAMGLLKSGLSAKGYEQATTIMGLENLLLELEGPKSAMTRNTQWYFVSVFGEPSNTGKWGWRFEGHHLSVNYTLDKGEVVAGAPMLFGSNPAEVKEGAKKGLRPLPEIEDRVRELITSLNDDQEKLAQQPKAFPEIKEGQPKADVGAPVGVTADKLTDDQKDTLMEVAARLHRPDARATGRGRDETREGDPGRETVLRVQRLREAGRTVHLPRAGAGIRGRVPERASGQREEPGQSHPQRLAPTAHRLRAERMTYWSAGFQPASSRAKRLPGGPGCLLRWEDAGLKARAPVNHFFGATVAAFSFSCSAFRTAISVLVASRAAFTGATAAVGGIGRRFRGRDRVGRGLYHRC